MDPAERNLSSDNVFRTLLQQQEAPPRWTVFDQERLMAFDKLFTRFLDFQNNTYHQNPCIFDGLNSMSMSMAIGRDDSSEASNNSQSSLNLELSSVKNVLPSISGNESDINPAVLEVMFCVSDQYGSKISYEKQSKNGIPFIAHPETLLLTIKDKEVTSFLKKVTVNSAPTQQPGDCRSFTQRRIGSSELNPSFVWLNILDISILPLLAFKFRIHELCLSAFSDSRMHSSMTSVNGELLVNMCVIQILSKLEVSVCKLAVYISDGIVITYERRILQQDSTAAARIDNTPKLVDRDPNSIVAAVRSDYLCRRCADVGPAYLLYTLFLQALVSQEPCVEFLSVTARYVKQLVHRRLSHKEKQIVSLKMHMVQHCIAMVLSCSRDVCAVLTKLAATVRDEDYRVSFGSTASGYRIPTSPSSATSVPLPAMPAPSSACDERYGPYISETADAFNFMTTCMVELYDEVSRLDKELDTMMFIRTNYTTILLSLIATIFMPMTFFAGVFGMNFQTGADYTIPLLNDANGPQIFYILCAASAMVTIVFFVSNGWLEIPLLRRLQKAIVECCRRCSPSVRSTTGSAKAASALSHSGDNNNNAIFEEDSMNVFGQMESLQFTDAQRREAQLEELRRDYRRKQRRRPAPVIVPGPTSGDRSTMGNRVSLVLPVLTDER